MGAAFSRKMVSAVGQTYEWLGQEWDRTFHPIFHYGVIPMLFAIGLAHTGDFTLDPLTLFQKVVIN